jgi:opacity protein-like surface antigen
MRKRVFLLLCILIAAGAIAAGAQAAPAATARNISITVGGMGSIFQPEFNGNWTSTLPVYPVSGASVYPEIGVGAFVDVKLSRWVQFEAEGRWLRFNNLDGISQDNYLIGPRLPIHRFWKATVYGKALVGFSKMTFDNIGEHGSFTTFAFGGGVDVRLTHRLSLRALDVEYQYWPAWGNSQLMPYGASAGIAYRVF